MERGTRNPGAARELHRRRADRLFAARDAGPVRRPRRGRRRDQRRHHPGRAAGPGRVRRPVGRRPGRHARCSPRRGRRRSALAASTRRSATAIRSRPATVIATVTGPMRVDPDGRAHGPELRAAAQRRGHPDARVCRRRGRAACEVARHAEDHAGLAAAGEVRRPGRRRHEPPHRPLRHGPHQGQPLGRPRRRHRARPSNWPAPLGRGCRSRSRSIRSTNSTSPWPCRPDVVLLDNMPPDRLRGPWPGGTRRRPACCSKRRAE